MAIPGLNVTFKFTERAAKSLGDAAKLPGFQSAGIQQQPVAVGDRIRFPDLANCPWFVVNERYWELAAVGATLTIWLDELND